jgi:hypothetical protein
MDDNRELDRRATALAVELQEKKERYYRALAGDQAEAMLASKEEAKRQLSSPDESLHRAAIVILADKWDEHQVVVRHCLDLLLSDVGPLLQMEAISCLSKIYRGVPRLDVCGPLLSLVMASQRPPSVRGLAYLALKRIYNESIPHEDALRFAKGLFSYDTDADHSFLRRVSADISSTETG